MESMKKLILICSGLLWTLNGLAISGQAYMDRFDNYKNWYQNIPITPSTEFLAFIQETTPLSQKLREKWLYELARTKNWEHYTSYYQPSNDLNLTCYQQIAQYNLGHRQEALQASIPLWLNGNSQPQACNNLFDLLLQDDLFDQQLITQRIGLALDKRNLQLATHLLKQYKQPKTTEASLLARIHRDPTQIKTLSAGQLHDDFYLYGLKRMASANMEKAIQYWKQLKTKSILNEPQQQAFLSHIALYKAMRNDQDAYTWFNKIKPQYYTDQLIEWQIRLALKKEQWKRVATLINDAKNKEQPCWQYWLARSLEKQGNHSQAQAIYETLAKQRQYYGFLASIRLKKTLSFENELPNSDFTSLKAYLPVIEQIENFYRSKQSLEASRLLNDFISELPKEEASALLYWVDNKLQWHGKSVYLSSNETLNNQLSLRFPLAYKEQVKQYTKKYTLRPEFVYAIIRQESGFREDVVSSVGARGLMQVMPNTALAVTKTDRIPYKDANQLFLSEKNINIGSAYLKQLGKRFSNHPVLIAAAYNAGPRQVVHWIKSHPPKEIDVWIETLPWQETRNYLKNVMAFYAVYQYRLDKKPDLRNFLEPF